MNRLKQLRLEKKLLQSDIAQVIDKTDRAVGQYEREERDPGSKTWAILADYFGVSLDYLLGKSDIRSLDDLKKQDLKNLQEQLKSKNISQTQIDTLIEYMSKEPVSLTYDFESFLNSLSPEVKQFIINFNFDSTLKMLQWALEEKEFHFAYHKEMEGLTDEEIADALRFYKEMKKKVKGDK